MDHGELRTQALAEIDDTDVGPAVGPGSHLRDDREPPGLGAVAPAAVGHADPGVLLQGSAAPSTPNADTMEHVADDLREGRRRRVVDARCRRARARRHEVRRLRRRRRAAREGEGHRRRVVRVRRVVARDAESPGDGKDHEHIDLYLEGSRPAPRLVPLARCSRRSACRARRRTSEVITHGFVLDENGIPYSKCEIEKAKAEGKKINYIEPDVVIKKSGAEMFRLWVGSTEFRCDIPYSADDPRRQGVCRVVPQAPQHRAVPARQPQGLRSGRARSRDCVALGDRSLHARAARRVRDARAQGVRGVRAARRAPPARRLRHRRPLGALRRRHEGPAVLRRRSTRRRAARRRSCCTSACARSRRWPRRSSASPPRTSGATCRKRAGDPDSVHLALFPRPRAGRRRRSSSDFEVLLAWRERVTKALEPFRAREEQVGRRAGHAAARRGDRADAREVRGRARRSVHRLGRRDRRRATARVERRGAHRDRAASAAGSTTITSPPIPRCLRALRRRR